MKTLRTIYPYGPNERAIKHDSEVPVGKLFFSIPRSTQRSARYRNNNDYLKDVTMTNVFTNIHSIIQNDIKDAYYKIWALLNNLLKQASELLQNESIFDININNNFYNSILDITDSYKLGKTIANNILNYKDVVNSIYIYAEVSLQFKH